MGAVVGVDVDVLGAADCVDVVGAIDDVDVVGAVDGVGVDRGATVTDRTGALVGSGSASSTRVNSRITFLNRT